MPRRVSIPAALAVCVLLGPPPAARGATLADAIALAYETNPNLQAARAGQRALDENWVQANAGYGPTAQAQATVGTDTNNYSAIQALQKGTLSGQIESSGATLSITQPLYTGGRVASQVTTAQAQILAGRESLIDTEQQVLQNVIGAYVDVRRDTASLAIDRDNLALLRRQLDESRARVAVGDITRTDLAETEARVAAAESQVSAAEAQLGISRAEYAAIVGETPADLAPEPSLARLLPDTLDEAFDRAERANPQLRQSVYTEQASAAKVAQAKAQTRPTLALQASLGYYGFNLGEATPFANFRHDISASAVATVPIFTGGLTSSQIRQAAEYNNVDRIGIETKRRQVLFSVAQAWNQLLAARAALTSDEIQVRAANVAFEGSRQEARVGLRTTLDVLITEQDLSNAELAMVGARHDEYVAAAALLAATGGLLTRDLATAAPLYDPAVNARRVRDGWPRAPLAPAVSVLDHIGAPAIDARPAVSAAAEPH